MVAELLKRTVIMDEFTTQNQSIKVDQLHLDTNKWKSSLRFITDETVFLERLLNSYVFEPNTPNLFERLMDYQERLKKCMSRHKEVVAKLHSHERDLGGMMECTDTECDLTYYRKHDQLKAEVADFQETYALLKTEIFNYAGGILKKRKPNG
jgi:hypothetical protein